MSLNREGNENLPTAQGNHKRILTDNLQFFNGHLDVREPSTTQAPVIPAHISGFKHVGDNIDFGIKARYMRSNQFSNHSLHYFNSFAVLNRIDLSGYSDTYPHSCLDQPKRRAE